MKFMTKHHVLFAVVSQKVENKLLVLETEPVRDRSGDSRIWMQVQRDRTPPSSFDHEGATVCSTAWQAQAGPTVRVTMDDRRSKCMT